MKNEAVRIFFAVIALILVAMLTSPGGVDSPMGHPIQRSIAAENNLKIRIVKKTSRMKKTGRKFTISRQDF